MTSYIYSDPWGYISSLSHWPDDCIYLVTDHLMDHVMYWCPLTSIIIHLSWHVVVMSLGSSPLPLTASRCVSTLSLSLLIGHLHSCIIVNWLLEMSDWLIFHYVIITSLYFWLVNFSSLKWHLTVPRVIEAHFIPLHHHDIILITASWHHPLAVT